MNPIVPITGDALADDSGHFDCTVCEDRGMYYVDNVGYTHCNCAAAERYWRTQSRTAGVPRLHHGLLLPRYSTAPENAASQWAACEQMLVWAKSVRDWKHKPRLRCPGGVLLYGSQGTGKSTLAAAAANSLIRSCVSVRWMNGTDLYLASMAAQATPDGVYGLIEHLRYDDVLVLDDLGTEKVSEFAQTVLYAVLESRANDDKVLLATSNLDTTALSADGTTTELSARLGGRNASRLLGLCRPVALGGTDLRGKA